MDSVLAGQTGYLFLTGDANDTVAQITGQKRLTEQQVYNIALSHYSRRVFGKTIARFDYWHAVIPSKEVAMRRFLPNHVQFESMGPRPIAQYCSSASAIWQPFYHPDLLATLAGDQSPYYPLTDSHWNHVGAFRYLRALLDAIDDDLARALESIEMRHFPSTQQGDLGLKLGLNPDIVEIVTPKHPQAQLIFDNGIANEGSVRWFRNPSRNGQRALVLHDSFTLWLLGYLSEMFQEILFIHTTIFDFTLVKEFNPTTVLCLQAERFFVRVPETGGDVFRFISQEEVEKQAERRFADAWINRQSFAH